MTYRRAHRWFRAVLVAALATTGIIAAGRAAPALASPAEVLVVHGIVTLPGGSAAGPGLRVILLLSGTSSSKGEHASLVLGEGETDGAGRWSIAVPTKLPPAARRQADSNGGVLNALAVTTGRTADGVVESAVVGVPVAVGSSTGTGEAARAVRARNETAHATLQVVAPLAQPSASVRSRSRLGRSTASVLGGVGYADARVTPDVTSCQPGIFYTKSSTQTGGYVVVGEAHAYLDSWASFSYETTAGTGMSVGVSYNMGASFSASGTSYLGNSFGFGSGYSRRGPHFAYQWKAPMLITRDQIWEKCTGGDQYVKDVVEATTVSTWAGGQTGAFGANVSSLDGPKGFGAAPAANRSIVVGGSYFAERDGRSQSYANAVTAWGFGMTATTDYSTSREQRIDAGTQAIQHDIWGLKGAPGSSSDLVFYSY